MLTKDQFAAGNVPQPRVQQRCSEGDLEARIDRIFLGERVRDVADLHGAGEGKQAFCWVVKGGQAVRTPIALGLQVGGDVEVISGLKGDKLAIQSQVAALHDGRPVEIATPQARP
jgi:hypothetical protein